MAINCIDDISSDLRKSAPRRHIARFLSTKRLVLASSLLMFACEQPPPPGSDTNADDDTTAESEDTGDTNETTGDGDGDGDMTGDGDGDGDMTGDGDGDPGEDPFADTLYPLAEGAQWTYIAKNINGQVLGMEIVDVVEIDWNGEQAWLMSDNPNANGEWTESVITHQDVTRSIRVHKEVKTIDATVMIVDYDPGFPRVDDTWDTLGFSIEVLYDRTETDGNGLNPKFEPRGHQFTVVAVDESVTVPAGTFNCVKISRVRTVGTSAGEESISWYAFGVGKVKEETPADSRVEELASVSLPGGVQLP